MKSKYEALLFDLDDTLIDNDESMKYAIFKIYEKMGIECSEENFQKWKEMDTGYWHLWESGQIPLPDWANSLDKRIEFLRDNRFVKFFNINYQEAVLMNDEYIKSLSKNIIEMDGAYEVISSLHDDFEIVISTNGPLDCAKEKISAIKLSPYIDKIAASGVCGFSKPMTGFFEYAISMMDTKDRSKMLIIGDSLTTDVLGGINNGIDCCWYNPKGNKNTLEMSPTYEIDHLKKLVNKL